MSFGRPKPTLKLSAEEQDTLSGSATLPQSSACAEGVSNSEIMFATAPPRCLPCSTSPPAPCSPEADAKACAWLGAQPGSISTTRRPISPGSIRWNAGSDSSPSRPSVAAASAACATGRTHQPVRPAVRPALQPHQPPPCLDRCRRFHPAETCPTLSTYFGDRPLELHLFGFCTILQSGASFRHRLGPVPLINPEPRGSGYSRRVYPVGERLDQAR